MWLLVDGRLLKVNSSSYETHFPSTGRGGCRPLLGPAGVILTPISAPPAWTQSQGLVNYSYTQKGDDDGQRQTWYTCKHHTRFVTNASQLMALSSYAVQL